MALDRQINLFKVDTNAFLTKEENEQRAYLIKLKKVRSQLFNNKKIDGREKTEEKTYKKYLQQYLNDKKTYGNSYRKECKLKKYNWFYMRLWELIREKEAIWKEYILESSANSVAYNEKHINNKHIRDLDERYLSYIDKQTGERKINLSNQISMFESTLSRSFGVKQNELTYDIFVVEIYYYDIAKDIILNGFNYNGKHYVYFSSSAGQIRTKKAVFVEENKLKECQKKLMCGLTIDSINSNGGMNINKYLAYLALANSATDLWEEVFNKPFDIDKCIVVNDFETLVKCKVDDIDYQTYEINPGVKKKIPIPHTDGCGMILPSYCKKNFMVRLPWIKGLLGSFDFRKFVEQKNCSPIVIDAWGDEHNVIEEDIQVIFTESQLKMKNYYATWDDYKKAFKENKCEAGICNMEENKIPNAKINYQMLQTLYDATDEELEELCEIPNQKIKEVSKSLDAALNFFGVDLNNFDENGKSWYQKALWLYPELLTDPADRADLHDLKKSYVKKYRGGHLDVMGKFTFVLPDLYAFCEWLFIGNSDKDYIPEGVLKGETVYCRLYTNNKLDCLRSPHLYIEHAVRKNVYNQNNPIEWFDTDAIYTSTFDPISRVLQFDVDGDRLLVISQPTIIKMAERVNKDVYPLYYEMHKAKKELIDNKTLYKGLELAFTGGRIGPISNDITKIWNSGNIDAQAKNAVKWLCMETNFTIDYAKTLFKPTRPKEVDKILKMYGKSKTPYFFQYAKDKDPDKIEPYNDSMMNRITKIIKENRNMFAPIKNLNTVDIDVLRSYEYNNDEVNKAFDKWNRKYGNNLKIDEVDHSKNNTLGIIQQLKKELLALDVNEENIVNSLVAYMYSKPSTKKKKLLWLAYGEYIYNNIVQSNPSESICHCCGKRTNELNSEQICNSCVQKEIKKNGMKKKRCIDCNKIIWVKPKDNKTCRCEKCQHEENLKNKRDYWNARINKTNVNCKI